MAKDVRIGFDVGGTFTDGVMLRGKEVLAKAKALTTDDVTTGIINALDVLLKTKKAEVSEISLVSLGTTHTTNAIIERKNLNKIGIFRLGAPATTAIPPLTGWPEDLKAAIGGADNIFIVRGGKEYDGRDIVPLDEEAIRSACRKIKGKVDSIAITGVFSPMIPDQEERAAEIIREELGDIPITLSNHIASISLLERENSTILNASVITVMRKAVEALKKAAKERGIEAPLFIVQNDGTVMSADYAVNYPIFTVASGPAASVRGAVYLSGIDNGVVVDIGGTSTDVAYIVNGFPRESSITVTIGGVKTNIRCPDLMSIALGGGTIVKTKGNEVIAHGPESVGYNLVKLGKSFGGPIITTHDIAVAKGILDKKLDIFDTDFAPHIDKVKALDRNLVEAAYNIIKNTLEVAVDQMKTVAGDVKAIFVGGGALVVPRENLEGISEVIMPPHFEVCGAIGTTIAEIGAYAEGVADLEVEDRDAAINKVVEKAKDEAEKAGAIRDTVEVLDVEEIPFAYMPGKREKIRIRVKGKIFE
ncbi:hydantoinase/oxoprolinase family protein [Biomaibacter acetigenes]|uniref:Hydantoinase/oxoprolinase family protein n=1 Tax=Biomaibacter acetigenes TaxID=2316383 RepID=A0A3G2R8Q5_9FIRM|nr:hydantoinase/oxoprolinase family protein [Biomaibacter acetigenes]AYO31765.1 hydantoinase/oxoprolinase family protein [Biomaibacter acetigenes]